MPDDASALEPLIGTWDIEASAPGGEWSGTGRTTFEWLLGHAFVLERSAVDHPDAPDSHAVVAPAAEGHGWTQHYFDSRGVVRLYEMGFDGREWTLLRRTPDFSPLSFHQRYVGTFSEDGGVIDGQWEMSDDGAEWRSDFRLTYRRVR
ncbi:hypothetical protein [Blastococcus sp. CT_GayMR16]|uniref:hypothetical protein n=1 Tax=Blastococcus sp. CT_GayMR16 TaxID=2559607 RepID=UPI001073A1C3|nr:hypothetical protein [Blastococcus sp. CT_GayMR16]TFV86948.1 hypothetical protein E4P38_14980 [Blastococcus sp. CT_GayMR16]